MSDGAGRAARRPLRPPSTARRPAIAEPVPTARRCPSCASSASRTAGDSAASGTPTCDGADGASFFHRLGWRRAGRARLRPPRRLPPRPAGGAHRGRAAALRAARACSSATRWCRCRSPSAAAWWPTTRRRRGALSTRPRPSPSGRRVDYLELRSERALAPELATKDLYVTFRADLARRRGGPAAAHGAQAPADDELRRARPGSTARVAGDRGAAALLRLFAESMRRHGTPVYPRRFLAEILASIPAEYQPLLRRPRTAGRSRRC